MFILAAIVLLVLNANAIVAVPAWLLVTVCIVGAIELGFYVLAIIINVIAFVRIKNGMSDIRKKDWHK